jgi:hypothetical protein
VTQFNVSLLIRGDGSDAEAALRKAGTEVAKLGTAAQTASRQTTALGTAQRKAAGDAEVLASKNQLAAGSVGNLFANFNDIGVMMASGQSPLQLAMQQGTQISQVLGPMGAAGAVRALGAAFLQLVSPINLITIGAIAAGAAMFQWLTSSGDAALTLDERIEGLKGSIDELRDGSERSLTDIAKDFGRVTPEILEMEKAASELKLQKVLLNASAAARGLKDDLAAAWTTSSNGELASLLGSENVGERNKNVTALRVRVDIMAGAETLDDQLAAAVDLRETFAELTGGIQNMTAEQQAFFDQVIATEAALRSATAAVEAIPTALDLALGYASALGGVAAALEADLVAAWNAATGVAGTNMAGPISAAATAAAGLAGFLQSAAAAAWSAAEGRLAAQSQLDQMKVEFTPGGQALNAYGSRGAQTPAQRALAVRNTPANVGRAGRAGGGGGGAARAEADAIGELIARLRGEIDLAREADPVQREMLRLRKELTGATSAQRTEVETLIATREREKAAMESLNYVSEQAGDALIDKLMGAAGAGERLIQTLSRAVLQAALLGQGPLAGLFGGVGLFGARPGGGGILGAILGTVIRPSVSASASAASVAPSPPRFGKAGISASAGFAGGGASAGVSRVQITLGPGLMAQILDQARDQSIEITQTGLQTYDREALPARVQAIGRDPRRKG